MWAALLLCSVALAAASPTCARPSEPCGNVSCVFGTACVAGVCEPGVAGKPCQTDDECDGIFLDGRFHLCVNSSCVAVALPGDRCERPEDGECVGDCRRGTCEARAQGSACQRTLECGIFGFCNQGVCIDVPYLGEKCPEQRCQNDAFCQGKSCIPLFLRPVGQNCTSDDECETSSHCVEGICTVVPLEKYGLPCPCADPLTCVNGVCVFGENDAARLVGCREELRESVLCSSREKCFHSGTSNSSCSVMSGCFHQVALLRNCLFCNASVPAVARRVRPCVADVCLDAGLSHLVKVSIWVGVISAALLVASALIHAMQVRARNRQDKYQKL